MDPDPLRQLRELESRVRERDPLIRALLPEPGRFERLRGEARALLERYPDPASRPPLFCVPVGVKDVIRVDGLPTRAGSRLPPSAFAGEEASSVTSLRRAGALILGKTVAAEFAYAAPGPTRNPGDPSRTPGGSSSGSAAAVAAGMCPLALGTQTMGSVIRPAAFCGVVGFKPSYGRIPADGVIPCAPSLDHVGLFAADVRWVCRAAAVLCTRWRAPKTVAGGKPVLGVPEGPYLERASEEGGARFRESCRRLAEHGYQVRPVAALDDFDSVAERHVELMAAEMAEVHSEWFARFGGLYRPPTVQLLERGRSIPPGRVAEARRACGLLRNELTRALDRHGLDLWIAPAARGPAPPGLASTGDPVMNLPWTGAGLPVLALPAGRSRDGLPLGVQIVARYQTDEMLLTWGREMAEVLGTAAPR